MKQVRPPCCPVEADRPAGWLPGSLTEPTGAVCRLEAAGSCGFVRGRLRRTLPQVAPARGAGCCGPFRHSTVPTRYTCFWKLNTGARLLNKEIWTLWSMVWCSGSSTPFLKQRNVDGIVNGQLLFTGKGGKRRTKPSQDHSGVWIYGTCPFLIVCGLCTVARRIVAENGIRPASVQGLAHTVRKQLAGRQGFAAPRHPQSAFAITHYAGQVPPRCRRRPPASLAPGARTLSFIISFRK